MKLKSMRKCLFVSKVNMGTSTCYLYVLIWIIWKSRICICSVPDPCPEIQPSSQVTDMCQTGLAIEQIGESQYGTKNYDHVTLRAISQEDNCICLVFIENQSLHSNSIYVQPYDQLKSSAPKESECGLELDLGFYNIETLKQNQITDPVKCTSGQTARLLSLNRNSVLRFTSKVISGNFTRGYCIDIQRVHVNGQNGTLKIVCDVPGRIPLMNLTTTQSPNHPTGQPSSSTRKDESTLYIAVGGSAGGLLIIIVVLVIRFYRRKLSDKSKKTSKTSTEDTTHTYEHDDPDYNGLKYNMLYVSGDHHDALEGNYHTVDNNQLHINKKVLEDDINYSTVDDVACPSFNTVPTHEVGQNARKVQGFDNTRGTDSSKVQHNCPSADNSNVYAVVDKKKRVAVDEKTGPVDQSQTYAVVDKTRKK